MQLLCSLIITCKWLYIENQQPLVVLFCTIRVGRPYEHKRAAVRYLTDRPETYPLRLPGREENIDIKEYLKKESV
jgi:hypothetical protein